MSYRIETAPRNDLPFSQLFREVSIKRNPHSQSSEFMFRGLRIITVSDIVIVASKLPAAVENHTVSFLAMPTVICE